MAKASERGAKRQLQRSKKPNAKPAKIHPKDAPADADRRLSTLLDRARGAVVRVKERELAPAGISTAEAAVLFAIDSVGNPATPSTIAHWIQREPHSTSKLLQRMERKGLVTKTKDLARGNYVRVEMTDKGHAAYEYSLAEQSSARLLACLSDEEKAQLDGMLRKVLAISQAEIRSQPEPPYP